MTRDGAPALKWAIDTAATPGRWGDLWGDTHFAHSLARALRRLGQSVTVDRRDTRDRNTRAEDDVVLTLRGLEAVQPSPGPVNLLWVISHPDDVKPEEAVAHDVVFAASPGWAQQRSREWEIRITPLLQCTDAEICDPGRARADRSSGVVFIGNARRGAHRPIVDWVAACDAELEIIGSGWGETPHARHVTATSVPNAEVGAYYAGADVVLNDHWADMRSAGFISNRLFDAVACGARVLSDPVPGVPELFGAAVVTCDSSESVRAVLAADRDTVWPDRESRQALARRIRSEHSFDRRAEVLLDAALTVRHVQLTRRGTPARERLGRRSALLGRHWWRGARARLGR